MLASSNGLCIISGFELRKIVDVRTCAASMPLLTPRTFLTKLASTLFSRRDWRERQADWESLKRTWINLLQLKKHIRTIERFSVIHLLLCALNMFNLAELTKVGKRIRHLCNRLTGYQQCRSLLLTDLVGLYHRWVWKWCSGTDILSVMWTTRVSLQIRCNLYLFWSPIRLLRLQFCTWHKQTFFFTRLLSWGPVWIRAWGVRWAFTDWSTTWWVVEVWLLEVVAHSVLDLFCEPIKRVSQIFRNSFSLSLQLLTRQIRQDSGRVHWRRARACRNEI